MKRLLLLTAVFSLGCLDQLVAAQSQHAPSQVRQPLIPSDAFVTLKTGGADHDDLCTADAEHPNFPDDADLITKAFCQDQKPGGVMPTPRSLADLLALLDLQFKDPNGENGKNGNPGFAILGHSSALTARKVSSLTPTAFVFTPPPADGSRPQHYAFLAFDPGETFVEVAVDDATVGTLNFYIVLFDKDCSAAGCANSDLLTQNLVTGWSNVRVYEDETELDNTIADCHVCHDPENTGNKTLRMQEIMPPFTHWFSQETEGGRALYDDFHGAHAAGEDYGPIPGSLVDKSDPALMAKMIAQAGFGDQPNVFDSATIEAEIKKIAPKQPATNVPPGWSPTWEATYNNSVKGNFIAAPYHDVKVTDPTKLQKMSDAYKSWVAGGGDLPDIRDVFWDAALRDLGFAPKENSDGHGLLVQMCQECHNSHLDPKVTRDRFLVDQLSAMSREEKDLAITRLQLPDSDRLFMPPPLFRTATDQERKLMIAELQK